LLEETHAAYKLEVGKLLADTSTLGVSVFGDGATIVAIDCSEH
jgi:hypothetical protein